MASLNQRTLEPEWIDDPGIESRLHVDALRGLERINRWSLSPDILWPFIEERARKLHSSPIKILDIATGAGDIPLQIWKKARRSGLHLQIEACDKSATAVKYAQGRAAALRADIRFFTLDVFRESLPENYQVTMSSLFLHHLNEEQALHLLQEMSRASSHAVLINDLIRNPTGLALSYLGTRLLTSSKVVHHDGPQSVRAAFTIDEVRDLAAKAGLEKFEIFRRWPCRFLFVWKRQPQFGNG